MVDASLRATILESLRELNRDLGISIIYITHDLTTAYQICDNIVVLYLGRWPRSAASTRSSARPSIRIRSCWWRRSRWPIAAASGARTRPGLRRHARRAAASRAGCPFAPRCPSVMDICHQSPPPLFLPDAHRAASCFLYRTSPELPTADVASVFADGVAT